MKITQEDRPEENKELPIVIKREGKKIGRVARFNNGLSEDGIPLPLE